MEAPPIQLSRVEAHSDPIWPQDASSVIRGPEEAHHLERVELEDEEGEEELDGDGYGHQDFQADNSIHLVLLTYTLELTWTIT